MRSRRKEETERETGEKDTGMEGNVGRKGTGSKEAGKERDESHPINTPKTRTQKNTKGALTADSCQCMVKPTTVL